MSRYFSNASTLGSFLSKTNKFTYTHTQTYKLPFKGKTDFCYSQHSSLQMDFSSLENEVY